MFLKKITPFLLATLALPGFSCAQAEPIVPATPIVLAARVAAVASESFDALGEGELNRQNGWIGTPRATVQSAFNSEGGGKALQLAAPDGAVSKVLVPEGIGGIVAIDFKVLLDGQAATPSAKILFFLRSSDKKRFALFYHDENNYWGVKSGNDYPHVKTNEIAGKWQSLRLVTNFNDKTISVYLGAGAQSQTLFSKIKLDDPTANDFAAIEIARNGQGNAAPVYVDQISVSNIESDEPPKIAPSVLSGEVLKEPRFAVYSNKESVAIVLKAERDGTAAPDTLEWRLLDWKGVEVKRGSLPVSAGKWTNTVRFDDLPAGCYSLGARLKNQGDALPARGSRPADMLTFGITPAIPPLPLATAEDSRFGMWGGNFIQGEEWLKGDSLEPLVTTIGPVWNSVKRRWNDLEPDHLGQWKPNAPADAESEYLFGDVLRHKMPYVVALEGIPAWNINWKGDTPQPAGKLNYFQALAYGPKDYDAYADFLRRAALEQVAIRKAHPYMTHSYYLIQHEPDWHWKDDDASLLKMYEVAHKALHEADPQAVLLGPRYAVLKNGLALLERQLPMGLGKSLDGLAFHGYYLPPKLLQSPEVAGTPDSIRRLRELSAQYLAPGAKMMQLEWGVRYNGNYDAITPDILRLQAAQTARGHLIALGEGAATSYLFYTSDFSAEPGYGLTFNLDMPKPDFGAMRVSPKPSYMACVALSRLLEGTQTLGRVENADALGYNFKRGAQYLLAIWSPQDKSATVQLKTAAKNVQLIDLMGDARVAPGGNFALPLDGNPIYVLSDAPIALGG